VISDVWVRILRTRVLNLPVAGAWSPKKAKASRLSRRFFQKQMFSANHQHRVAVLNEYDILDTFPETSFERLTRLAATIFGTPIALISLIDEDRQWFKSHHGLDATETPLSESFCLHAVENGPGVFVVPDATRDDRFVDNPLVTGAPGIRFYAGAPLCTSSGARIGTLCVIDTLPRPRALSSSEKRALEDLAAVAIDEMELRRNLLRARSLKQMQQQETAVPAATEVNG
jgi:GAF domain-containing protein